MTTLIVLLSVAAYSAVIYAAILLFRLIFKKHVSPSLMYVVWFLLIARLMIPVTVDSGFSLITLPAVQTQAAQDDPAADSGAVAYNTEQDGLSAETADVGSYGQMAASHGDAAASGFTVDLPMVLIAVWMLGMLLMLSQTLAASIRLKKRLLRDSVPVPEGWLDIAEKIKAELNVRGNIRIMMIKDLASPALNASLFPSILMPEQMAAQDAKIIGFALRHEIMHLKRKDHLACLLLLILRVVYWFNPVIWLASKQIKMDMETACDSAAVSPMNREETKRYAVTVLEMYANENATFVLGMSLGGTRKTAERRIRGIFMRKRSSYKARIAAAVLAAVMLIACFTTACQPVQQQPSASASNTPTVAALSPTPGVSEPVQSMEPTASAATSPTASPTTSPTQTPTESPEPTPTQETTPAPKPVAKLPKGVTEEERFTTDADGDGTKEAIVVGSIKDSYMVQLYVLYAGGYNKIDIDEGTYKTAYLTRTGGGKLCLLVSVDEASEDYMTYSFSFSGTKPVLKDEAGGYIDDLSGTNMTLCAHIDVIGTWDYSCRFKLNNNFTIEQTSDMTILESGMQPLHTIRELPVEKLVGDSYVADTLPAGTRLVPRSTDGKSYMKFTVDSGYDGQIRFTRGEHVEVYIEGVIESEYFDNIVYSD